MHRASLFMINGSVELCIYIRCYCLLFKLLKNIFHHYSSTKRLSRIEDSIGFVGNSSNLKQSDNQFQYSKHCSLHTYHEPWWMLTGVWRRVRTANSQQRLIWIAYSNKISAIYIRQTRRSSQTNNYNNNNSIHTNKKYINSD